MKVAGRLNRRNSCRGFGLLIQNSTANSARLTKEDYVASGIAVRSDWISSLPVRAYPKDGLIICTADVELQ